MCVCVYIYIYYNSKQQVYVYVYIYIYIYIYIVPAAGGILKGGIRPTNNASVAFKSLRRDLFFGSPFMIPLLGDGEQRPCRDEREDI